MGETRGDTGTVPLSFPDKGTVPVSPRVSLLLMQSQLPESHCARRGHIQGIHAM